MNVITCSLYRAKFGPFEVTGGVRIDSVGNLAPGSFTFRSPSVSAVKKPEGLSFLREGDDAIARVDFPGGDFMIVEGNYMLGRLTANPNEVPSVDTFDPDTKHISALTLLGAPVVPTEF